MLEVFTDGSSRIGFGSLNPCWLSYAGRRYCLSVIWRRSWARLMSDAMEVFSSMRGPTSRVRPRSCGFNSHGGRKFAAELVGFPLGSSDWLMVRGSVAGLVPGEPDPVPGRRCRRTAASVRHQRSHRLAGAEGNTVFSSALSITPPCSEPGRRATSTHDLRDLRRSRHVLPPEVCVGLNVHARQAAGGRATSRAHVGIVLLSRACHPGHRLAAVVEVGAAEAHCHRAPLLEEAEQVRSVPGPFIGISMICLGTEIADCDKAGLP